MNSYTCTSRTRNKTPPRPMMWPGRETGSSTSSTPTASCCGGSRARASSTRPGGWRGRPSRASAASTTRSSSATSVTARSTLSTSTPASSSARSPAQAAPRSPSPESGRSNSASVSRAARQHSSSRPASTTSSTAFLGPNDFFVHEKATGKVQHVVNGVVHTVLTLPVNSFSERGLLGIALQPDFSRTHGVYLYWTQSKSGTVSADPADVPLLGNRVDRYVWDPSTQTLTFDKNIIVLRSFQADANQPLRGNHDAGKILFGPDGKLYFQIGDQGRRGQLQNLASGPFGPGQADDQFGGPAPDDAHLTGVIFRLNPNGTTPKDNPFANVTTAQMAQLEQQAGVILTSSQLADVTANVHKIYSYGRRNGFGLAFDPATGSLWESENGDDAFDEVNRITPGSNGGWVQIMGPASRIGEFKGIETKFTPLQGNLPLAGNLPFSWGAADYDVGSSTGAAGQRSKPVRLR